MSKYISNHNKLYRLLVTLSAGFLLVFLPLLMVSLRNVPQTQAAWYGDTWQYRRLLTIDHTQVSGGSDLTNFPVLVSLTDVSVTRKAQSDGDDILFTSSDGSTQLDHEIEKFDQSAGRLVAWVRMPTLSYTADTSIYIYYGNPTVTSRQNKTGVWETNYVGVWHLSETSGNHTNSTGTAGIDSSSMSVTQQGTAAGIADGADEFNGSSNGVYIPDNALLRQDGDMTIETWVRLDRTPSQIGASVYIIQKGTAASPWSSYNLWLKSGDANRAQFEWYNTSGTVYNRTTNSSLQAATWYHVVGVKSGTSLIIYLNGVDDHTAYNPTTTGSINDVSPFTFCIARLCGSTGYLDGIQDEVRYSNTARTPGWISTTYNTVSNQSAFWSARGAEEKRQVPVLYWGFDEGFGLTAHDTTPGQNHGTLSGAVMPTWQTEDMCVSGKCLSFNGSTASVSAATAVNNVKSVSFWIRPKSATETILDLDGGTHYLDSSTGTVTAHGFSSPTVYVNGVSGGSVSASQWNQVTVTTATAFDVTALSVGKVLTSHLNGSVDEFKLYDYERTAAQAKSDNVRSSVSAGAGAAMGITSTDPLNQGLVGYWKMDESSGNASDMSGNGYTLSNGGATAYVSGKFGNGSEHIPASAQYFYLSSGDTYDYCFNASDLLYDNWTDTANAFDCDIDTYAYESPGMLSALTGAGTNAPTDGDSISTVKVRSYGYVSSEGNQYGVNIAHEYEDLGGLTVDSTSPGWTGYVTLGAPTGGWTWQKINDLSLQATALAGFTSYLYESEVQVTTSSISTIPGIRAISFWINPDSTTNHFVSLTSGVYLTSTSGTLSATGFTNPKIYVNGTETTTIAADTWQHVTITTDTAIDSDQFFIGRVGSDYYDGSLDEVRIYNRVLSPSEVAQLYTWAPGPVGWWKMDEGSGLTANDSSGNGYTGTISDATALWRSGKYGNAIKFDGYTSDDYINIPDNDVFSPVTTGAFTVEAWVNMQALTDDSYFVNKRSGSNYEWYLGITDTKFFQGIINNPDGTSYMGTGYNMSATWQANTWYHLAFTFDNSVPLMKLYLNGKLVSTDTDTSGTYANGTAPVRIGCDYSGINCSDSLIDDVKIYNYPRSASQIIQDANAGHPAPGSPVGSSLLRLSFDEGHGDTAHNTGNGGSSLDADLGGGTSCPQSGDSTCPAWTNDGKFGKALSFSTTGTDDYASVADSADIRPGDGSMTISVWAKPADVSQASGLVCKRQDSSPYPQVCLGIGGADTYSWPSGQQLLFTYYSSSISTARTGYTNRDVVDGNWHQYVAVADKDADTVRLYVDGKEEAITKDHTLGSWPNITNTNALLIGHKNNVGSGYFDGPIDEVEIYKSALTADQIRQLYNHGVSTVMGALSTDASGNSDNSDTGSYCPPGQGSTCVGPVAEWKFDEKTGTIGYDSTGNGNNMVYGITLSDWRTGKLGSSIYSYLDTVRTSGTLSSLNNASAFTKSYWVKIDNHSDYQSFAYQTIDSTHSIAAQEGTSANLGRLYFYISNGSTAYGYADNLFTYNTWFHIQEVYNGGGSANADKLKVYINGQAITLSFGANPIPSTTADLSSTTYRASNGMGGLSIDEMKIYNYARTPAQVAWDYNRGEPVASWQFDECEGAVAYDASGSPQNGTINPGDTSGNNDSVGTCSSGDDTQMWNDGTSGKRNASLGFDGTNDNVIVADNSALRPGAGSFTVSAWIKTSAANQYNGILGKWDGTGYTLVRAFRLNLYDSTAYPGYCGQSGKVSFVIYTAGNAVCVRTTTNVNDGVWHLITAFRSTNGTMKIYVDGNDATNQVTVNTTDLNNTVNVSIGAALHSGGWPFNGQIDDVKYFNYALTEKQIKLIYNEGAVRFGPQ